MAPPSATAEVSVTRRRHASFARFAEACESDRERSRTFDDKMSMKPHSFRFRGSRGPAFEALSLGLRKEH